ncbi:Gryzun, putative trafficking through Golgi family protein [Leishmania donovani]|uniref:Gryzun, putative trafficking through Golgi family protein n=1 Tax=Leishmania donovani TaxID=5661 RepID=A0A504XZR3_LEIDO|nr:Gryzun, putative trafficking through Golgi family protein [Leishmania donovani]
MNFLTGIYSDASYRFYWDTNPRFCVAAVASHVEDAEKVSQVLQQVSPRMTIVCTDKIVLDTSRKAASSSDASQLLRSDWCVKRQKSVFSCIVLVCFLDRLGVNVTAAKLSEELVLCLGASVESMRCDVVFAPVAESTADSNEELRDSIEKSLRSLLGSRLAGSVLQTIENGVWRGIAALQSLVFDSTVAYHKGEVRRLRDRKEMLNDDSDQRRALPGLHFKIGWHYLVLHNFSSARQQMLSSSEVYQEIRCFVDWIGTAYGGSVKDECQTVVLVLTKVMEAEWLEYLARKTENLMARQCCDYLVASAQALQDCDAFFPSRKESIAIEAPSHIGEEELLGNHASALWKSFDKSALRGRIARLLAEAKAVSSSRETEVEYLAFLAGNELMDGVPDTEMIDRMLVKASSTIISRLAEMAWGSARSWSALSPRLTIALLLHGCVDALGHAEQERYYLRMHELEGCLHNDVVLEYPKGRLQSPFTAVAYFDEESAKVVGDSARVVVTLYSTSAACINVDVRMLALSSGTVAGATETQVPFSPARCVKLSASCPQELAVDVPLSHSGEYVCTSLTADVHVGGICATTRWRFAVGPSSVAGRSAAGTRAVLSAKIYRQVLQVLNPPTTFRVECPSLLEAVEGECAECDIVISCALLGVRNGYMTLPHEPKLFRAVCWASANEPLPVTETGGQARYAVPDLAADESVRLLVSIACIRSAEFRLPIAFEYSTDRYGGVSCCRTLHISVDPPFNAEHSMIGGSLWGDAAAAMSVPSTSSSYAQYDKSVLVKAADIFSSPLVTNWKDDCALYFFTKETTAKEFVFQRGDTVTLSSTFRCTAKRGITVLHAEVVAGDDVDVLSFCCGEESSFLEEGECVTMVTRFQAKRLGRFNPGFIRIFFAPQRTAARLYSDVCIPTVYIEDFGVQVSAKYPLVTPYGSPLELDVSIYNAAGVPFIGELLLDPQTDDFVCAATTRRSLQIGPTEGSVTRYVLTPLRAGELKLPRFHVRCDATSRLVASADESYVVHVLP